VAYEWTPTIPPGGFVTLDSTIAVPEPSDLALIALAVPAVIAALGRRRSGIAHNAVVHARGEV
ncbi:MAG TPA: PEP-CTERM sorting domain-containing protein, partial [Gemmataceae bacterium]